MKAIIYTLLAATLAFFCVTTACAGDGDAHVTQTRKVEAFRAIDMTAVGQVVFTQADRYSLTLEGEERFVQGIKTEVRGDGTLHISLENKKVYNDPTEGVCIRVSAPSLEVISIGGVGSFVCEGTMKLEGDLDIDVTGVAEVTLDDLRCRRLDVQMSGVGAAQVEVDCDHVDARMSGVGSVTLRGVTRTADLHRSGIGTLEADGLKITEE